MSVRARPAIHSSAAALAAALVFCADVLAHGGETSLVAEPSRVAPGDGVAVQADLLTSGLVSLALVGIDGSRREAGIVDLEAGSFGVVLRGIRCRSAPNRYR